MSPKETAVSGTVRLGRLRGRWARVAVTFGLAVAAWPASALANYHFSSGDSMTVSGIGGHMCVDPLTNDDPTDTHVNETIWLSTSGFFNDETEVGIWRGLEKDGYTDHARFYWEDFTPSGGNWHGDFNDLPTWGDHYWGYIRDRDANWFDVVIDDWTYGQGSYQQTDTGNAQEVGVEWTPGGGTNDTDSESGAVQGLGRWDLSDNWEDDWPGSSPMYSDSPGNGRWYQQGQYQTVLPSSEPWTC